MSQQHFDSHGTALRLGKRLGSGGEGAVFQLASNSQHVAKLYHGPIPPEKAHKLRCMANMASPELTRLASWPVSTIHSRPNGDVIGIVMPYAVNHVEIHNLYSPAHRKVKYPDKDWSFLVHVAMNCAAAFHSIHSGLHVIGDVNQGNVLVSAQGTVFLIDCDSFQVSANGKVYPCEVGVAQFTPPELQGRGFRGVYRTANHDCFGLAVLVFHILLMGRHPFIGRFSGAGEMPPERAISEFRYVFSSRASQLQMAPPPHSLNVGQVLPGIADLFERAFARGSELNNARPTALEWHRELSTLKSQLKQCNDDRSHIFPSHLSRCPWCELVRGGAPAFFISVTLTGTATFKLSCDAAALWRRIEAIARPSATPPAPVASRPVIPKPPPEAIQSNQQFTKLVRFTAFASAPFVLLSCLLPPLAYVSLPVFAVFTAWWLVLILGSPQRKERSSRRRILHARRTELAQLQSSSQDALLQGERELHAALNRLENVRDQILSLQNQYDTEYRQLETNSVARQKDVYLQSVFTHDHLIMRIGQERKAVLASYGVETAYDVEWSKVSSIPGFGPVLTRTLLEWRKRVEAQFRFDPAKSVPLSDRQALATKYKQMEQQLAGILKQGPNQIEEVTRRYLQAQMAVELQVAEAVWRVRQAEADLAAMG